MVSYFNPAEELLNVELSDGWKVIERVERKSGQSGGKFSVCYIVEKSGTKAFLKALDLTSAFMEKDDTIGMIQSLTYAFVFERTLLYKCKDRHLSKIVTPIAYGQYRFNDVPVAYNSADYIIFDMAKNTLREQITTMKAFDLAWILRSFHHIAVGIKQLHQAGIAHQDLKPSNVLVFERDSKIADLGRSSDIYVPGPNDNYSIPGDRAYAPFELSYLKTGINSNQRFLVDLYHLGSLVFFYFLHVNVTQIINTYLRNNGKYLNLTHNDFEADLPFYQEGFLYAIESLGCEVSKHSTVLSADLLPLVKMLCEPDPKLRGHPATRSYDPSSLDRFVSRFDYLAQKAEYGML